jgi:hypothetical protein
MLCRGRVEKFKDLMFNDLNSKSKRTEFELLSIKSLNIHGGASKSGV